MMNCISHTKKSRRDKSEQLHSFFVLISVLVQLDYQQVFKGRHTTSPDIHNLSSKVRRIKAMSGVIRLNRNFLTMLVGILMCLIQQVID